MSLKNCSRIKRIIIQFISIAVLICADLFIKKIVTEKLYPIGSVKVIEGIFEFSYVRNTGAAWGMFGEKSVLLSVIVGAVLILMTVYLIFTKETGTVWHICLPMIIAGGAANLFDRLINGFVTDYLRVTFIDFPVFNLADCFIVVGCIVLIIYLIYDIVKECGRKKDKEKTSDMNEIS